MPSESEAEEEEEEEDEDYSEQQYPPVDDKYKILRIDWQPWSCKGYLVLISKN